MLAFELVALPLRRAEPYIMKLLEPLRQQQREHFILYTLHLLLPAIAGGRLEASHVLCYELGGQPHRAAQPLFVELNSPPDHGVIALFGFPRDW